MTNNGGAVVHLLAGLAAMLGHDVCALLDVGGVNHNIVLLMAHLLVVGLAVLVVDNVIDHVALDSVLLVTMTSMTTVTSVTSVRGLSHWGSQGGSGEEKCGADSVHHDADTTGSISSHQLCRGGAEANCVDLAQILSFIVLTLLY